MTDSLDGGEDPVGSDEGRVSSPTATGGGGTFFEQHVDAYWLALLLVRSIPPILHDSTAQEVHFQTQHLGWATDDFLLVARDSHGRQRKLAGQVKRAFTVSAADDECRKTVLGFWKDFRNSERFTPGQDRLAIVVQRGTNTLLEYFAGLLDCARSAGDGIEFDQRLRNPGFISKTAARYCDEICTIIGDIDGAPAAPANAWPFLKALHVLSLDLFTSTRQVEANIKALLAYTAAEPDAVSAANATWNSLLAAAAEGMAQAAAYSFDDLPQTLRDRHSPVGTQEHRALQALREHSQVVLRGIRSTIGDEVHLKRAALVQEVVNRLGSAQVVLLSGRAGSGKSALAKEVISQLSSDHFAFAFRAEEFAEPHFDATLQKAQIPVGAAGLGAILAGQNRKIILVESVERLLEKSARDAFSDLLALAARDNSFQILLTCRDYSTDLVRASFLAGASIEHAVVPVPELDDVELHEVQTSLPSLGRPLASSGLRQVLRNLYFLDKALQVSWSDEGVLPETEREFRATFWQQVVRADHRLAAGAPHRRERAFTDIAVRRARALSPYVSCEDLDIEAVDSLRHDSLIAASERSPALVAPNHDVLEDWAILRWLDQQHLRGDDSFRSLAEAVGAHPAMRRAFRKWVAELIETDPEAANQLFSAVWSTTDLSPHFRDDTLVSFLRAPSSPAFLQAHRAELYANGNELLKRSIHLVRVACVTVPNWLRDARGAASLLNVPDGPAWASLLEIVQHRIPDFDEPDRGLLLGFIEDWARGVSLAQPYPPGAQAAAKIAHWLLSTCHAYSREDDGRRVLGVIAKIPNADPQGFTSLLERAGQSDPRDYAADTFRDMIFSGLDGNPAARDMPDAIVAAGSDYLLCSEAHVRLQRHFGSSLELEPLFGVRANLSYGHYPPSAYRGPWLSLLRHHRDKALSFFVKVFNHSADWYAHPRVADRVEPPHEVQVELGDGASRTQWANPRLWNWYRGTSVGPHVLQSVLMALEHSLFELARDDTAEVDQVLVELVRRSDSGAITAVAASLATAFPHRCVETLLLLLGSPPFIWLDRQRLVAESQTPSHLPDELKLQGAENDIYDLERKQADGRPHRRRDLEGAISALQLGPAAERVQAMLDRHRAVLPPISDQTESDRLWRLSMHRMDLRRYSASEVTLPDPATDPSEEGGEAARRYLQLELSEPEPDIKPMVDESAARWSAINAGTGLLMWGLKVFGREEAKTYDPEEWRDRLRAARDIELDAFDPEELHLVAGAPATVAAVCVRDHWDEMSAPERDWCVETVCAEVMRSGSEWNQHDRVQKYAMRADRNCARIMPLVVAWTANQPQQGLARDAFATALTHSNEEVRWYATHVVASQLWTIDRNLALRCVNALATEAALVEELRAREDDLPFERRRHLDEIAGEAATAIRERFWQPDAFDSDAAETLDTTSWFGAEALGRILTILNAVPEDPEAVAAFTRAAETLVSWWDSKEESRRQGQRAREHSHESESVIARLLPRFVMRTATEAAKRTVDPLLDAVDRHPGELHWFLRGLISVEATSPRTDRFWLLWRLFAGRVKQASWADQLYRRHPMGRELLSALFLAVSWRKEVRHWKSLEGHAHNVHGLFMDLPAVQAAFEDYVRFLYHIGEKSLPTEFIRVAERLELGDPERMLSGGDTVFMLEVLLQRHVYGKPLELKRDPRLREAVLRILDLLVERGSSAAFRMRDDFVTPVPAG